MLPFNQSEISKQDQIPLPSSEPVTCHLDENIFHPFGPASQCIMLRLRDNHQKLNQNPGSNNWIEALSPPSPNIDITEQIFFNGFSTRSENIEDDLLTHTGYEADIDSSSSSSSTITPYEANKDKTKTSTPEPQHISRTITETNTDTSQLSQHTTQTSTFRIFEPWLSTIFHNTLTGHMTGATFEGGAEEQDEREDECPFCSRTIGDERDQYLLRCRYAHEERAREERMGWLLVRGRRLRERRERRERRTEIARSRLGTRR